MKNLKVTEIVNEIKFERVWAELEAKNCFQRQSFIKYLRETLVFMLNGMLYVMLYESASFC